MKIQRLPEQVIRRQVGGDRHRAALAEMVEFTRRYRLAHVTSDDSGIIVSLRPRTKIFPRRRAYRAPWSVRTITSNCSPFALVSRHLPATEHGFDGARHHIDADAHGGFSRLTSIEFRLVQAQVDVGAHDAGLAISSMNWRVTAARFW